MTRQLPRRPRKPSKAALEGLERAEQAKREAYPAARAEAQAKANATGFDYGLEFNPIFREFRSFMLPRAVNRSGHELRCEVVSCEVFDRIQPGHGPGGSL